jgi:hypothetical protein
MFTSNMHTLLDISLNADQRGWVALLVGVGAIAFLLFRPKFRKKDPLDKPSFSSLSQQRSVERQMQNLLVELSEMTRQMNAQVDTQLEGKPSAQDFEMSDTPVDAPTQPVQAGLTPEPPMAEPDSRHAEIYSLADQGRDAREIASRLNRPSGEVELILALRPRA